MDRNIWIFCNNPGGTNGVMSVINNLNKEGIPYKLFANGIATDILTQKHIPFVSYASESDILSNHSLPSIILSSICSTVARDLILQSPGCAALKRILLQDYWGAGLKTIWNNPKSHPDYIIVNDRIDQTIILNCWPDYQAKQVIKAGYPAFDRYYHINADARTRKFRNELRLADTVPIISFAGSVIDREFSNYISEAQVLKEVINALNELNHPFYFLPRQHPRFKINTPEELPKWQEALRLLNNGSFIDTTGYDIQDIIACSDVVISTYSTVLIEACLLRKPNISIYYPEIAERYIAETNHIIKEFPLISLGCTAKAVNRKNFVVLLKRALANNLNLESAQKTIFKLDGQNGKRAVDFIKTQFS